MVPGKFEVVVTVREAGRLKQLTHRVLWSTVNVGAPEEVAPPSSLEATRAAVGAIRLSVGEPEHPMNATQSDTTGIRRMATPWFPKRENGGAGRYGGMEAPYARIEGKAIGLLAGGVMAYHRRRPRREES